MSRNLLELFHKLSPEWQELLSSASKEHLTVIQQKLDGDFDKYEGLGVYPAPVHTFRAFASVPPQDVRVVIIGQDCYHQPNQAMGLCFGINPGTNLPPSLINIKRELGTDLNINLSDFSLSHWSEQGVLLLNSALTVRQASPGSHLPYWKGFTDRAILDISNHTEKVVFLLWGRYAQAKQKLINSHRGHLVLTAKHPSPLSANRGGWFGSKHFSQTNDFLRINNKSPIDW
jgi:uracil-DNA glycosylase